MQLNRYRVLVAITAVVAMSCSGGEQAKQGDDDDDRTASSSQPAPGTGDTIIVEMYSDGTGNYYKPNDIEADPGDIVRFVLKSGVHNVNFLPDSNEIKTGLPAASEMLQLPDQTYDLVVSMKPGHYYFQCDPHAALGMKGRLEVEDD